MFLVLEHPCSRSPDSPELWFTCVGIGPGHPVLRLMASNPFPGRRTDREGRVVVSEQPSPVLADTWKKAFF